MSKIKIGNIKGPKGDRGEQGAVGPKGEQGIQGPVGPAGGVDSVNGKTGDVDIADALGYTPGEVNSVNGKKGDVTVNINALLAKNAGAHNSIFRGDSLGTSVTETQYTAISNGSFDNLFVGDYWTIDNIVYRIAGFDLFLYCGDTELKTHHAVVVPDKPLYNGKMNDSDTTTGAYNTSLMKTSGLNGALERVKKAFGETHIIKHKVLLTNAISEGSPSGWSWYDSDIDLMTERQVYGSPAWGQAEHNGFDANSQYSRFPLFALAPEYICACRQWWWLQDVRSASAFCRVSTYGSAAADGASNSRGVRPAFLIG